MRKRDERGISLMELMVAITASVIVILALGNIIVVNQTTMSRTQDKATLQQNLGLVMTQLSRSIRGANRVEISGTNTFNLRDGSGVVTASFQCVEGGTGPRLQRNGIDMADLDCSRFAVTANADTTCLTLDVVFEDNSGCRATSLTTVSIRNRTLEN